jgi:hypothetical protein
MMLSDEEAKAVQEISKTTSNAIDVTKDFGGFVSKFISGPLEQWCAIKEDNLKYKRWENQQKLIMKAEQFMKDNGIAEPTRIVPLKIAVSWAQNALLEEDEQLQDAWAKLLVNFGNKDSNVEPQMMYIDILNKLSPLEAKILERIYRKEILESCEKHGAITTKCLPNGVQIYLDAKYKNQGNPPDDVIIAMTHLIQLGCLEADKVWAGGKKNFQTIFPTFLGKKFVEACSLIQQVADEHT